MSSFLFSLVLASLCLMASAARFRAGKSYDGNQQLDALLAFKKGITDDPTGALRWWHEEQDPCDHWPHVFCYDDGQVHTLSLPLYNLRGTISPRLSDLKHLTILQLNDNKLMGSIPESLALLPTLRTLDVANNELSGPIPTGGYFSEFPSESFEGNPGLCGKQVHKDCYK